MKTCVYRGDYGRIINISTDAAQIFAGQITYGASKATLEALTRSIALEVAEYGITGYKGFRWKGVVINDY